MPSSSGASRPRRTLPASRAGRRPEVRFRVGAILPCANRGASARSIGQAINPFDILAVRQHHSAR
jgi:hypothetical protein